MSDSSSSFTNSSSIVIAASVLGGFAVLWYIYNNIQSEAEKKAAKERELKTKKKMEPPRNFTVEELSKHDGTNPEFPAYLCVRGEIFDVSAKVEFYGPGGPYANFAGKDASKALGKTELSQCNDDITDLSAGEISTLNEWYTFFKNKYRLVGYLPTSRAKINDSPATTTTPAATTATSTSNN